MNQQQHYQKLAESYSQLSDEAHNAAIGYRARGQDVSALENQALRDAQTALKYQEKADTEANRSRFEKIVGSQ